VSARRVGVWCATMALGLALPATARAVPEVGFLVTIEWEGVVDAYYAADDDPNDHVVEDPGMTGRIEVELVEGVDTSLPFSFGEYDDGRGEILGARFSLSFDDPFPNAEFPSWSGCDVSCILSISSADGIFFEGLHDPEDVGFYVDEVSTLWDQSEDGDCSVCGNYVRGQATSWSLTITPVPEPGTALLVGLNLLALAARARSR